MPLENGQFAKSNESNWNHCRKANICSARLLHPQEESSSITMKRSQLALPFLIFYPFKCALVHENANNKEELILFSKQNHEHTHTPVNGMCKNYVSVGDCATVGSKRAYNKYNTHTATRCWPIVNVFIDLFTFGACLPGPVEFPNLNCKFIV